MKNQIWHTIPLVRLFIPFVCGIGVSMFYSISFPVALLIFILLFVFSLAVKYLVKHYRLRWIFGFCISAAMFLAGVTLHTFQNDLRQPTHFSKHASNRFLLVQIDEEPVPKSSSYKMVGKVLGLSDSSGANKYAVGKLLIYLGKDDSLRLPQYGNIIVVPCSSVNEIRGPQNPDEFNYKRYLAFRQIYFQAYIKPNELVLLSQRGGNPIMVWVYNVQHYFKDVLTRTIQSKNETAVAQALLYGFDDDIDAETVQAYSNTGTLHVLAVSGMHVGLIFMILAFFLSPLDKLKKGKILKQVIILIMLWVYSFICGLSPSILRATVMFSFIIVSNILGVRSSVYNTLAASAITLLCFDANMLANVGFQLSYLAVLGIVFFQPLIEEWYTAPNWFMRQVWSITAVSLAAQLITFPVGLLYFHQFPNCFLFSNLIIIPLTTGILYGAIALLCISKFVWLSWLLGQALYYTISFTNTIVKLVEHIPYAYTNGLYISILQSILLYAIIFFIALFLLKKNKAFFIGALSCLVIYVSIRTCHKIRHSQQHRVLVYNINKYTAIRFIDGTRSFLMADSSLLADQSKVKFHLQQHYWTSGIKDQDTMFCDKENWKKISFYNHQILITGSSPVTQPMECDLLIVKNDINVNDVLKFVRVREVIVTSEVKLNKALAIQREFLEHNINTKCASELGAIEL
jgi:competence protein ComEC